MSIVTHPLYYKTICHLLSLVKWLALFFLRINTLYIDSLYYFLHFHFVNFWPDQVVFSCFPKPLRYTVIMLDIMLSVWFVCVYVHVCAHVYMSAQTCSCGNYRWALNVILNEFSPYFFETVSNWTWFFQIHTEWLGYKSEESHCFSSALDCTHVLTYTLVVASHNQILTIEWQTFYLLNQLPSHLTEFLMEAGIYRLLF